MGYSLDGRVIHSHGGTNSYSSTVASFGETSGKPRTFTFVQKGSGKKTYINGILAAQSNNITKLSNISSLAIGKGYQGDISEIIVFNRALDDSERQAVEKYTSSKTTEPVFNGISCTTGKITGSGCDVSSCNVSLLGSNITSIGIGSGNIACNAIGYTETLPYTCSDGTFTPTGTCSCDTANGYSLISGTCQITTCTLATTGVASATVNYGNPGTKDCDNGYSGSINYTCITPGVAAINSGSCTPNTCTISGVTGFTGTVNYGTTSRACDSGYSGNITYTCAANGVFAYGGGTCTSASLHWTYVGNYNCAASNDSSFIYWTTQTCDVSHAGRHAFDIAYYAKWYSTPGPSGLSWHSAGWADCYCANSSSCAPCEVVNCDYEEPFYGGYRMYRCDYDSCTVGQTLVSGTCQPITCNFSSFAGINNTSVAYTTTSTTKNCNATGYSGYVNYTCTAAGGVPSVTGSCSVSTCAVSGTPGLTGTVNYGTTHKDCDSGYIGGIDYTCSADKIYTKTGGSCTSINCNLSATGIATVSVAPTAGSSRTCDSGYTGAVNYTCTSGSNAVVTGGIGCTPNTCTISGGITGFSGTVNYGTTSKNCNDGYAGQINYTCSDGEVFVQTGGSCTTVTCTLATTGLSSTTVNYGSGTQNCNSGYTGSINYSCTSGSATVTGGSCTRGGWLLMASDARDAYSCSGSTTSFTCNLANHGKYIFKLNAAATPTSASTIAWGWVGQYSTASNEYGWTSIDLCNNSYIDGGNSWNSKVYKCIAGCSFNTTGIAAGTSVAFGSGTQNCNSGYTGSVAYSCTTPGQYATVTGGSCAQNCNLSAPGITTVSVSPTSGASRNCDSGWHGSVNYTCTSGSNAVVTEGVGCKTDGHWVLANDGVNLKTYIQVGGYITQMADVTCNSGNNGVYFAQYRSTGSTDVFTTPTSTSSVWQSSANAYGNPSMQFLAMSCYSLGSNPVYGGVCNTCLTNCPKCIGSSYYADCQKLYRIYQCVSP